MAEKYLAYPEYKDSRVEWLGEIPKDWEVSKLRYMFSFGRGLTITKADLLDTGIPCVNYGEVHSKYGFEVDPKKHYLKRVDAGYLQSSPYALLTKGDLVFADTSEDIEGSGNFTQLVSDDLVFAGYHTVIARPFDRKCSRFYAYLMDSKEIRTQIRHMVKGVKVFSITQSILKGVDIWLPSLDERETIANFLDHETAQIDTLIDKQQTLIQLLKEKRQAVISHAVTQGLNPDTPMKDSGVEWLGEVPEHWEALKLKRLVSFSQGVQVDLGLQKHEESDKSARFLRIENYTQNSSDYRFINPILSQGKFVNQDELVMVRYGASAGYVGRGLEGVLANNLFKISPTTNTITNNFLSSFLKNSYEYFQKEMSGSAMPALNFSMIEDLIITLPPIDEQKQIADYIDKMQSYFDSLTDSAEQAIQLMQERRTALISAAVTGKIDVRGWRAVNSDHAIYVANSI